MRKYFLVLILFFCTFCTGQAEDVFVSGSFYNSDDAVIAEGLLLQGRYIKASQLTCTFSEKECILLSAVYVSNGILKPSLYPQISKYQVKSVSKTNILAEALGNTISIDRVRKKIILILNSEIYEMIVNQEKIIKTLESI